MRNLNISHHTQRMAARLPTFFAATLFSAFAFLPTVSSAENNPSVHMHAGMDAEMGMTPPALGADTFEVEMYRDMTKMMTDMHAPGYTGNRDIDFLAMMIPHHQGAIDMARLLLIDGVDPLTRSLAEGIIAAQQTEINAMQGRLKSLQAVNSETAAEFPALSGTRGVGAQN